MTLVHPLRRTHSRQQLLRCDARSTSAPPVRHAQTAAREGIQPGAKPTIVVECGFSHWSSACVPFVAPHAVTHNANEPSGCCVSYISSTECSRLIIKIYDVP